MLILSSMFRAEHDGLAICGNAADYHNLGGAEHLSGLGFLDDDGVLADRQFEHESPFELFYSNSLLSFCLCSSLQPASSAR